MIRTPLRVALALVLVGCGGALSNASEGGGEGASIEWEGRVRYDARHPTPQGLSEEVEERPARRVSWVAVDAAGEVLAEGRTDDDGAFRARLPATAVALEVRARVEDEGHDLAIAEDGGGASTYAMRVPLEGEDVPCAGERATPCRLDVHAHDDAEGLAGAFHTLDTMLEGVRAVRRWTGQSLPPVYVYWMRGGTREWSYYRGERPHGSGRYALELLGGDPGQRSISDTDEHDESIILHELGHFVMDRLSGSNSSTGGMHPRGIRIDPGLAWEEGRATFFAQAVLGHPHYRDTIGMQPWGSLRVDENLEFPEGVRGGDAEASVGAVLWDLADGGEHGLPDEDEDGVALGPAAVLRAMFEHGAEEGALVSLYSFLDFVARSGLVERGELRAMLERTGEPVASLLPDEGGPVWPLALPLGAEVAERIDGLSQPAPSGGRNLPSNGYDAIRTFRVDVAEAGFLRLSLHIDESVPASGRQPLTLELRDGAWQPLAASPGTQGVVRLGRLCPPGSYVVRVRSHPQGSRADFRLSATMETL